MTQVHFLRVGPHTLMRLVVRVRSEDEAYFNDLVFQVSLIYLVIYRFNNKQEVLAILARRLPDAVRLRDETGKDGEEFETERSGDLFVAFRVEQSETRHSVLAKV